MWEGVLHVVPPPKGPHQVLEADLLIALASPAKASGLVGSPETGVFRPGTEPPNWDYRVPDLVYSPPEHRSERGVEGVAALVVEIRSTGDESYEKLSFYFSVGVREVLIIDRDTLAIEVVRDGQAVAGEADGAVRLESLDVTLQTIEGPGVVVIWGETRTVVERFRPGA
jgi:Uma2 family endonuclease